MNRNLRDIAATAGITSAIMFGLAGVYIANTPTAPALPGVQIVETPVMPQTEFPCQEDEVLGYHPRFGTEHVGCIHIEELTR